MACHVRGKRNLSYLASYPDFYTTHSFWAFFPADLQADCRSRATLCEATSPIIEFPRPKNKPMGLNPPRWNPTRLSDCPALARSIRIPGFSCDHWLLNWCCSFSTMIPGTAPKRHTSPPHGDASSQLITTNVEIRAQEVVSYTGREWW